MNNKNKNLDTIASLLGHAAKNIENDSENNDRTSHIVDQFKSLPSAKMFYGKVSANDRITNNKAIRLLFDREGIDPRIHANIIPLFEDYNFFKNHLKRKVDDFEGNQYCGDKADAIINLYCSNQKFVLEGKSVLNIGKDFGKPNFPAEITLDKWFNLVEALIQFRSGVTDGYFEALNNITAFYKNLAEDAKDNIIIVDDEED